MEETTDPDENNKTESPPGGCEENENMQSPKPSQDEETTVSERKVTLSSVAAQITCGLCQGYLVDALTVTDCVHSFCRSCIVKYLGASDSCPKCGNKIYMTLPLLNIRSDKKLQSLVYTIVPNLFQEEMLKRRDFYQACPPTGFDLTTDQQVSLCLRLCDRYPPYENIKEKDLCVDKRFLLCPASFTVSLLEKFVRLKFNLGSKFKIELFCENELLYEDFSLLDVALVFGWQRKKPLLINYVVNDLTYMSMRKLQMVENKGLFHRSVGERRPSCNSTATTPNATPNDIAMDTHSMETESVDTTQQVKVAVKTKKRKSSQNENDVSLTEHKKMVGVYKLPALGVPRLVGRPPGIKRGPGRPPKRPPVGVIAHQAQRKIMKKLQEHSQKVVMIGVGQTEVMIGTGQIESNLTGCIQQQKVDNTMSVNSQGLSQSERDGDLPEEGANDSNPDTSESVKCALNEEHLDNLDNVRNGQSTVCSYSSSSTGVVDLSSTVLNITPDQPHVDNNIDNQGLDRNTSIVVESQDKSLSSVLDTGNDANVLLKDSSVSCNDHTVSSEVPAMDNIVKSEESDLEPVDTNNVKIINIQPIQSSVPEPTIVTQTSSIDQPLPILSGYQVLAGTSTGAVTSSSTAASTAVISAVPQQGVTVSQQTAGNTIINMTPQQMAQFRATSIITSTAQAQMPGAQPRVITGPYNVGYLPFSHSSIPKIKRKRGRPPKNRTVGFGRCSPMPHTLGLPGSPLYTLVKRKRGRPPKRKVGLPPVFVVPQPNNSQVYVHNLPTNQNVTFVSNVNGLQFSGGTIVQQQQQANVSNIQLSRNVQLPGQLAKVEPKCNSTTETKPVVTDVNCDKSGETDFEDSSLISQDVVGNIIDKLSDDKGMDTPPPLDSTKTNNHGNNTVYLPVSQSQGQILSQGQGQVMTQGQIYQQVEGSNKSGTSIMMVPQSGAQSSPTIILSQSKPHVSPYEKQFENFIHQKFQSDERRQLVFNVQSHDSGNNMIVVNNKQLDGCNKSLVGSNVVLSTQSSHNISAISGDYINSELQSPRADTGGVRCELLKSTLTNGGTNSVQRDNIPDMTAEQNLTSAMSPHSISQSRDSFPTSNPTSPESIISEGDLSFSSSKEGSTPNSKRHLSSSDLKEQKRHNIHKLTEKLYSVKKHKPKGGDIRRGGQDLSSEGQGDPDVMRDDAEQVNGLSQRKSVISTHRQDKRSFNKDAAHRVSKFGPAVHANSNGPVNTLVNLNPSSSSSCLPINGGPVLGTSMNGGPVLGTSMNGGPVTGTSVNGGPVIGTSVNGGPVIGTSVNGGPVIGTGNLHQAYSKNQKHQLHQQQYNGVYPSVSHNNLLSKPGGVTVQNSVKGHLQHLGSTEYIKNSTKANNSKRFAIMAQKHKQKAVQRLNNKNKSHGPFYVGVNVFNCPYIPQGAAVYSDPAVGQDGFMYSKDEAQFSNYSNGSNNNTEPLDYSLKKK